MYSKRHASPVLVSTPSRFSCEANVLPIHYRDQPLDAGALKALPGLAFIHNHIEGFRILNSRHRPDLLGMGIETDDAIRLTIRTRGNIQSPYDRSPLTAVCSALKPFIEPLLLEAHHAIRALRQPRVAKFFGAAELMSEHSFSPHISLRPNDVGDPLFNLW